MKHSLISRKLILVAFLSFDLPLWGKAQVPQLGGSSATAPTAPETRTNDLATTAHDATRPADTRPQRDTAGRLALSPGVDEVLKMMRAGVSTDVIRTYIENSPVVYILSPGDIIALKQHAVPDDITTAMLKRGSLLTKQLAQLNEQNASARVPMAQNRPHILDPESYEYFQYYYLLPRTLAAANQRLFSPYASFGDISPYRYGPYGAFRPYFPAASGLP